jgi:hypothetical protein
MFGAWTTFQVGRHDDELELKILLSREQRRWHGAKRCRADEHSKS